jgi:hypothetical protein
MVFKVISNCHVYSCPIQLKHVLHTVLIELDTNKHFKTTSFKSKESKEYIFSYFSVHPVQYLGSML